MHPDNYINPSFYTNQATNELIMMVIYDEDSLAREELYFRGGDDIRVWFTAHNLLYSSLWDYEYLSQAATFESIYPSSTTFEITTHVYPECEQIGFLKMTCDLDPECDQLKWWLEDESLKYLPCGIAYSKLEKPVDYIKASWASKIQILTRTKISWEKVFMFKSFAGLEPYQFYKTGRQINPVTGGTFNSDMTFRDPDIKVKIENARLLQFQLYDNQMADLVYEIIFHGAKHFENWFHRKYIVESSEWDFSAMQPEKEYFNLHVGYMQQFSIISDWGSCEIFSDWMAVYWRNDTKDPTCTFEKWWNKASVVDKFGDSIKLQPPYILYTVQSGPELQNNWVEGGKVQINVFTL